MAIYSLLTNMCNWVTIFGTLNKLLNLSVSWVLFMQNQKICRIISEMPSWLNLSPHLQIAECPANDMEMNIPVIFSRERDYFTFDEEETFLNVS